MKLSDAAAYFNNTVFTDAYGAATFKGKLMSFDDATRDALSTERRIVSVAPGTVVPARRAVIAAGFTWLVGDVAVDTDGQGNPLRHKYVLHQASELARMYTFGDALAGVVTKSLWGARLWVKGTKEVDESSGVYDAYTCYFSKSEDIRDPDHANGTFFDSREQYVLIWIDQRWHLVRTSYLTGGGFLAAVVDELPEPVMVNVNFVTRVYNPVPDTWTETPKIVPAVNLRWQSNFQYFTRYSATYENGDCQIKVRKADITPKAGDRVDLQGRPHKVVAVWDEAPVWGVHLRRD